MKLRVTEGHTAHSGDARILSRSLDSRARTPHLACCLPHSEKGLKFQFNVEKGLVKASPELGSPAEPLYENSGEI